MSVNAQIKLELWIVMIQIMLIRPLTDTQCEVEDAEPNVQPEEEDDVGHFTEQEQVAYVLLQRDWETEKKRGGTVKDGECSYKVTGSQDKAATVMFTQQRQVFSKALPGCGLVQGFSSGSKIWNSYTLGRKHLLG